MNKRVFFILAFFISIPFKAFAAVHITEIAWMGVAGNNGQYGEWIELHNDGDAAVSLSGWKLLGDGGGQLMYTFSKSIPAGGYLVAERTTTSMPDPVPGIDDERGTFGGGGFSNNGEDLVLQDANGVVIESLNFSSGWPAGDATTKETMQWDGSSWITAVATPKAATIGTTTQADITKEPDTSDADEENDTTTENPGSLNKIIHSVPPKKLIHPKPHIELSIPKTIVVHTPYKFNPTVYTKDDVNPLGGTYRWNFGDGTSISSFKNVLPSQHLYEYPGNYTLWFGYYMSEFDEDPILSLSTDFVVIEPSIAISIIHGKAVQLKNCTNTPVDLSNWTIESSGFRSTIPKMTLLGPKATITISGTALRIPLGDTAILYAPDGAIITIVTE